MQYLLKMGLIEGKFYKKRGDDRHFQQKFMDPSLKVLSALEEEGKVVKKDLAPNQPHLICIIEAESPTELMTLVHDLPYWPIMEIKRLLPHSHKKNKKD